MNKILVAGLLVLGCTVTAVQAHEPIADVIPRGTMPDRVHEVLRQAIESAPKQSADELKQNTTALDRLRGIPWPIITKLERVHLHDAADPKRFVNAWRLPGKQEVIYVLDDFQERRKAVKDFSRVVVFPYSDELAEIVKYLKSLKDERPRAWNFTHLFGEGLPYHGGVFLLYHAYAAASVGRNEDATFLMHEALKQRRSVLTYAYEEGAWQSFFRGIRMLEDDASRADVLAHWTGTLKGYGESSYRAQIVNLLDELKKQVEEDRLLAKTAVKDPEQLPLDKRIAYYIARFPDVRGQQWSSPGHCQTVGIGERTKLSDAVVKIGRPAVPSLIEHLDDTRLTRSMGFQRSFYSHRIVLRVQDVCVQCIESIVDIRFYHPTSTSSYLSNERREVREKVIADIQSWWKENGNKTPLQGYLARLDKGHLWDKIETLRKIESIDRKAIDSVATLKRWALVVHRSQLGEIGGQLAARGDFSLLPVIRQQIKDGGSDLDQAVWYLLRHGNAADFRLLREEARKDLAAGARLGTSRIFGAVASGVRDSNRPLAVPILVDFLDRREITGSRYINEKIGSRGFSCADSCLEALIRITGHNEGYDRGAEDRDRFAAIDRWQAWWKKEGQAAFLKKHPDVREVMGDADGPLPQVDATKLPPLVLVQCADQNIPVSYDVPRGELIAMLKSGSVIQTPGEFRFASIEAGQSWFAKARPVPAKARPDAKPLLTRLASHGLSGPHGPAFGPDGRVWFWLHEDVPIPEMKKQVEAAAQNNGPHFLTGVYSFLADSKNRLWVLPYHSQDAVYCFDSATKTWSERRPAQQKDGAMRGPMFEDRAGRVYVPDKLGVHVLDGDKWTYQPLYERNFQEKKFYSKDYEAFNAPDFIQDADGRVYLWSVWGRYGHTGTVGYWVHDGQRWHQETAVEQVRHLIPRRDKVWIIDEKDDLSVLEDGKLLTGEKAQEVLHPHLRYDRAWLLTTDREGTAYIALTEMTNLQTFARQREGAVLAIPLRGPAEQVRPDIARLLSQDRHQVQAGSGRSLWTVADGMLHTLTPKDGIIQPWPQTGRFTFLCLKAVDARGQPYFVGSGVHWRLDPTQPGELDDRTPWLPSMRVAYIGSHALDSRGRMWCTWNRVGSLTTAFDGPTWKTYPEASADRKTGEPSGYISAYPGVNGAMIFEDRSYWLHLFDDKGWLAERSAEALAMKHYARFSQALPYPPVPADDRLHKLVKDAKGRIWWAAWEHGWGVVSGVRAINGKTAKTSVQTGPGKVFHELIPFGDGSHVLAGTSDRKSAVLTVIDGQIVEVGKSPVPLHDSRSHEHHTSYHDSTGRLWLAQHTFMQAIDRAGKLAERVPGYLLGEDGGKALWFREEVKNSVVLVRRDASGKTLRLELPDLLPRGCWAAAPDGSVWVLTQLDLLRIRANKDRLSVVERYPVRVGYNNRIWCDGQGRVWHRIDQNGVAQLVLYATGR